MLQGDFSNALKSLYRCREYNSTPEQVIEMCMMIIKIHCLTGTASRAQSYLSKAENSITPNQPQIAAQLKAASALISLGNENYITAAHKFIDVPFLIENSFAEVIVPESISLCGVYCALASFSRMELKTHVLSNRVFKQFLETTPGLNRLVSTFYHCQYSEFLVLLEEWNRKAVLSIYLGSHVTTLSTKIRNRALIQYFNPYLSLSISKMADTFNTNVQELEIELAKLIMDGKINGRIDSHNKILYSTKEDKRTTSFKKAIQIGEEHQQDITSFILRTNLLKHNFVVENPGGFSSLAS